MIIRVPVKLQFQEVTSSKSTWQKTFKNCRIILISNKMTSTSLQTKSIWSIKKVKVKYQIPTISMRGKMGSRLSLLTRWLRIETVFSIQILMTILPPTFLKNIISTSPSNNNKSKISLKYNPEIMVNHQWCYPKDLEAQIFKM